MGNLSLKSSLPLREQDPVLASLYQRYWGELTGYLKRSFGLGPPEPEDVAQAAFARLAAHPGFQSIENPRAFLYTTARNIVVDHFRHQKQCDAHAADVQHDQLYEFSPERVFLGKEQVAKLAHALAQLPAQENRMFVLSRFHGLTHAEIAKRLGVSQSTVQKKVERALSHCLAHVYGPDHE